MVRSITNEFTVQKCDEMAPAKAYKLSLDDVLSGVRITQSFVFWVMYCIICRFVLFHLVISK
jgi:hypothetical protein